MPKSPQQVRQEPPLKRAQSVGSGPQEVCQDLGGIHQEEPRAVAGRIVAAIAGKRGCSPRARAASAKRLLSSTTLRHARASRITCNE